MRIARMDDDMEVIEDIGTVEKLENFSNSGTDYGNCLHIDSFIFPVGDSMDELFEKMLKEGYLDLRQYKCFERGI